MKKISFIPLVLLTIFSISLKGQISLGIDTSASALPNNLYYNSSYIYKATVRNYSATTYIGPVQVFFKLDSMASGVLVTLASPIPTMTIAPNDTASISVSINTDSTKFKSGINTVVIWPKNTTVPFITHDSMTGTVTTTGSAGIRNYSGTKPVIVFPNPVQNRLFTTNKDPNFFIEQVRIFDVSGRVVYAEIFKGSIDTGKLENGIYTIEFLDKTGKASRYKVIKE
jgi:hypothetical protein